MKSASTNLKRETIRMRMFEKSIKIRKKINKNKKKLEEKIIEITEESSCRDSDHRPLQ